MSIFNKIKLRMQPKTVHNLSYASKMSLPFGRLVPMLCEKVVPGDKFIHEHAFLMRFAPFYGQVFQQYEVKTEYFFVPSRILWNNFEMFLSDGMDGQNDGYIHPYFNYSSLLAKQEDFSNQYLDLINTIFDYFNLPTEFNFNGSTVHYLEEDFDRPIHIDALPFYAYIRIFLDYYADENLDYAQLVEYYVRTRNLAIDGDNTTALIQFFQNINNNGVLPTPNTKEKFVKYLQPFRRAYRKDYFTSALPFAQRGPIVTIPLNGSGPVEVYGQGVGYRYQGVGVAPSSTTGTNIKVSLFQYGMEDTVYAAGDTPANVHNTSDSSQSHVFTLPDGETMVNESGHKITFKAVNINGTATITDLRTAIAVQEWLEKRARSGVRPKEQIYASFGVSTRDYRLDRPELLFSSRDIVSIGEVFTTAQDDSNSFVPGLGVSTGTAAGSSKRFKHFFEEHGYVIGLMSVMPKAAYYQGIPRQFLELDKYDYYWPEFQHIGEQKILNCELMLRGTDGGASGNYGPFGYAPRYAHYKSRTDQIHGNFRTNLNFMHAGRVWASSLTPPFLNNEFVYYNEEENDQLRVFNNVTPYSNASPVYCDFYHNLKAIRPMSYFGSPRFI